MRNSKGQFVKGYESSYKGENSPVWKGGVPKCLDCGINLHRGKNKYCIKHRFSGDRNPRWKGGDKRKLKSFAERQRNLRKRGRGSFRFEEWVALKARFGFMCLCCKRIEPDIKLTQDHIIPLIKGGTNTIDNIQPLCGQCNRRKWVEEINYISQYYEVKETNI